MKDLDITAVNKILNEIVEYEMAGVVRYAHSSLMLIGSFRTPIVGFLQESLDHEQYAIALYKKLLEQVVDASVMLEEYARGQIGQEEQHALEIKKMLRDFA